MTEQVKIGIVTVTYNSASVLAAFWQSLQAQSYTNWQLYVVESNSPDNSLALVREYARDPRLTLLAQTNNVGFARGSNLGIEQALADGCQQIMLLNNDVEFAEDFIALLSAELNSAQSEIVAPKMYFYPPAPASSGGESASARAKIIWSAGGGFKPSLAWAAYQTGENELDHGQFDQDAYCDFVPLCCALINAAVFQRVGLLDEKYFIYSEDADWFYRARLCGVRLRYCYRAELWHKVSSLTGGAHSQLGASFGTRNRVYFICKHFRGFKRTEYLVKYFCGMWVALTTGKYSWQEFRWRLPAFFRGLVL